MTNKAFIEINEDGSVTISGGLVFYNGLFIYKENDYKFTHTHEIINNCFVSELPKWWQLKRWLDLYRLLKMHTREIK
jgi:hypothetical protein